MFQTKSFRTTSVSKFLKGGEMMKTLGLVLALLVVVTGASFADTTTVDVYPGFSYVALPLAPFDCGTAGAYNPESIITNSGLWAAGLLHKWDAATQSDIAYDPDGGTGWNMVLGEGYSYYWEDTSSFTVDGVADGVPDANSNMTDMWISLPGNQADSVSVSPDGGGWHLIGTPFNHDISVDKGSFYGDNIFFTDGTSMKTWGEALEAGWVDPVMHGWDAAMQSSRDVLFTGDDSNPLNTKLLKGCSYWLLTYQDNLAMIVPAN